MLTEFWKLLPYHTSFCNFLLLKNTTHTLNPMCHRQDLYVIPIIYLMAFLSYYILPDLRGKDSFKRKSALPGTVFFTTFWLVGSWGFSIYVNNLSTYNLVYGTIGAFFILMIWLYYTSILLLIGGEINSQVYNRLEHESNELKEEIQELRRINNLKHRG